MLREVLYYERQSLNPGMTGLAFVLGVAGLILILPLPGAEHIGPARGIPGGLALLAAVILLNTFTMTIWVYPDELRIQLGRLAPFYHRHIPLAEVEQVRLVEYQPLAATSKRKRLGLRHGEFEGERTQFLNARGGQGVLVRGRGMPLLVHTAFPQQLEAALNQALSRSGVKEPEGGN